MGPGKLHAKGKRRAGRQATKSAQQNRPNQPAASEGCITSAEVRPLHCGRHVHWTSGAARHKKRRGDFGETPSGRIGSPSGRDAKRQPGGEGEQLLSTPVPIPFLDPPVLHREPAPLARAAPPPACRYGGAMTPAQAGPPGRRAVRSRQFGVIASATSECQKNLTCGLRNLFRIGNIIGIRYRLVRHSAEKGSAAEFKTDHKRLSYP